MNEPIEDYLGDGVYASFDGYTITLDLRAQEPTLPITRIALEPPVLDALLRFRTWATGKAREQRAATEGETHEARS